MALTDIVQVSITRATQALERPGFGKLLLISAHRLHFERAVEYSDIDEIKDAGGSANDPLLDAAAAYFAQDPKPRKLILGRWDVTTTTTVTPTTVTNSAIYTITVDDQIFTFTADSTATAAEIATGLAAAINGGFAISAAPVVATKTFTIAGDHVAEFPVRGTNTDASNKGKFRVTGSTANNLDYTVVSATLVGTTTEIVVAETITDATVDGVIRPRVTAVDTTDEFTLAPFDFAESGHTDFFEVHGEDKLTVDHVTNETAAAARSAITDKDDTWYFVVLTSRLIGDITSITADIETLKRQFFTSSSDANIIDTTDAADSPVTGSVAAQLKGKSYENSNVMFHGPSGTTGTEKANEPWIEAAFIGARATTDPGSETWSLITLKGIVADVLTSTQRTNALAKNANIYTPITSASSKTEDGTVASGKFIDGTRFVHWLESEMTREVFDALANPPPPLNKIPYTDDGIAIVEAAARKVLELGVSRGGISSFTLSVPKRADVSQADVDARLLRNVNFDAVGAGAIHGVIIKGRISV